MKAKCLVAVVGILLLTLFVWFVKSPSGEPSEIYDRDAPNVVRCVTVDSEEDHIQHDPNDFFVDLWFNDKGTGETFFACCHVTGEDETHILEKTASLMELVTGGEGEYVFRLTLKPLCEYCYVLLGIELLEGQEA